MEILSYTPHTHPSPTPPLDHTRALRELAATENKEVLCQCFSKIEEHWESFHTGDLVLFAAPPEAYHSTKEQIFHAVSPLFLSFSQYFSE